METTNLYNYSFENALRGKTSREIPELSEATEMSTIHTFSPKVSRVILTLP